MARQRRLLPGDQDPHSLEPRRRLLFSGAPIKRTGFIYAPKSHLLPHGGIDA